MKRILILIISIAFIMLATAACTSSIEESQLIGVWQTPDFSETLRGNSRGSDDTIEIYITEEFMLYVHITEMSLLGHEAWWLRFALEIDDGELVSGIMPENLFELLEEREPHFEIYFDGETLALSAINSDGSPVFRRFGETEFSFVKVSDDVPYGWTDAQRQEIVETNRGIRDDIVLFAEKFGEAIGLSVIPRHGDLYRLHTTTVGHSSIERSVGFHIDNNIIVAIRFLGDTPTPARVQRHTEGFHDFRFTDNTDGFWDRAYNVDFVLNRQFNMKMWYVNDDRYERAMVTAEMVEIFISLLDD